MREEDETAALDDIETELTSSNGFLIAVLGQESRRRFMEYVNRWDLGWPHQSALAALLNTEPKGMASQKQLSAQVHIDPRNLVAILDTLEERKFIERTPNPQDRRSYGITLTPSGADLARELRAAGAELENDFFASLTQAEQDALHQLLLKLYRGIEGIEDGHTAK